MHTNTHIKANIFKTAPTSRAIHPERSLGCVALVKEESTKIVPLNKHGSLSSQRRYSDGNMNQVNPGKVVSLEKRPEREEQRDSESTSGESPPSLTPNASSNPLKSSLSPRRAQRIPTESKVVRINEVKEVKIIEKNGKLTPSTTKETISINMDINIKKNQQGEDIKQQEEQKQQQEEQKQEEQKQEEQQEQQKQQKQQQEQQEQPQQPPLYLHIQQQQLQAQLQQQQQRQAKKPQFEEEMRQTEGEMKQQNEDESKESDELKKQSEVARSCVSLERKKRPKQQTNSPMRERASTLDSPGTKRASCVWWRRN